MRFKIGDEILLGGDSNYKLVSPISGLSAPSIRTSDGLRSGVDGGYISAQLYGFRTITLTGFYKGDTCEEADSLRLNLMNKLHIRRLYPVIITTFSGRNYFTEAYITDVKSDITMPIAGEFEITLVCPDPIIYDGGAGVSAASAILQQLFYKEKPGGFTIPSTMPVQWQPGQAATDVLNSGTVDTFPLLVLRGKLTNPKITNFTNNSFVKLAKTINAGQELRIDMKKRIITLDGVSIANSRTVDSSWWKLERGVNRIVLTTDSTSDTDYGTILWKNGFEGI